MSRPRQQSSGSSLDNLSFNDDEFNRQDLTSMLPPSVRSRHESAVKASHTTKAKPSPRPSSLKRQDERAYYYSDEPTPAMSLAGRSASHEASAQPMTTTPMASVTVPVWRPDSARGANPTGEAAWPSNDAPPGPPTIDAATNPYDPLAAADNWTTGAPATMGSWGTGAPTGPMAEAQPMPQRAETGRDVENSRWEDGASAAGTASPALHTESALDEEGPAQARELPGAFRGESFPTQPPAVAEESLPLNGYEGSLQPTTDEPAAAWERTTPNETVEAEADGRSRPQEPQQGYLDKSGSSSSSSSSESFVIENPPPLPPTDEVASGPLVPVAEENVGGTEEPIEPPEDGSKDPPARAASSDQDEAPPAAAQETVIPFNEDVLPADGGAGREILAENAEVSLIALGAAELLPRDSPQQEVLEAAPLQSSSTTASQDTVSADDLQRQQEEEDGAPVLLDSQEPPHNTLAAAEAVPEPVSTPDNREPDAEDPAPSEGEAPLPDAQEDERELSQSTSSQAADAAGVVNEAQEQPVTEEVAAGNPQLEPLHEEGSGSFAHSAPLTPQDQQSDWPSVNPRERTADSAADAAPQQQLGSIHGDSDHDDSDTAPATLPVMVAVPLDRTEATEFDEFTADPAGGVVRQSSIDSVEKEASPSQGDISRLAATLDEIPPSSTQQPEQEHRGPAAPVAAAPTPSGSSSLFTSITESRTTERPVYSDSAATWSRVTRESPTHTRTFISRSSDDNQSTRIDGSGSARVVQPSAPDDTDSHVAIASDNDVEDSFSPRSLPPPSVVNTVRGHEIHEREEEEPDVIVAVRASRTNDGVGREEPRDTHVRFVEHLNTVVDPPPTAAMSSSSSSPTTPTMQALQRSQNQQRHLSGGAGGHDDELDETVDTAVQVRHTSPRRGITDGAQTGSFSSQPRRGPEDDEGGAGATLSVAEMPLKMTDNELQEARLRTYDESCTVSTLDFLRETGDSVLPDAVQNMFAATSSFFRSGTDAVKQTVPEPLRRAARKTGRGIALFADFTGDLIANAPEYVMTIIPDSVVSQETKQLVGVDFLSVLRVTLDVNVLAVPYVFRMAGLIGGLVIVIAMHLLSYYNSVAFFAAKNQLRDATTVVMYGDVPRMTWGKWFPMISLWYSAAFLTAYVTYAASNLEVLLHTMGITGGSATALALIMPSVFSLPLVFMKRASSQRPLAVIASLLVFVSVMMFMTVFPYKSKEEVMKMELRLWAEDASEFFVAMGIALYVFCPLRSAVPVERGMPPARFIQLLRVAMSIAFCCHLVFGLCAFIALRTDTCSVLAVSLPSGRVETAATAVLFFAFLCVIPLAQFRIGELCDRRILGVRTLPSYWQLGPNLMRMLFLAGAIVVAYVLPYYGLLVGLGGAFGCGIIGIVVPAALDYVRRERLRLRDGRHLLWWEYVVVFSNLGFGAVCIVFLGVTFSFYQLWVVVQGGYKATC